MIVDVLDQLLHLSVLRVDIGSLIHARVARLVYGATEPKTGAVESTCRALEDFPHNHDVDVAGGVLEKQCKCLVQTFFKVRR